MLAVTAVTALLQPGNGTEEWENLLDYTGRFLDINTTFLDGLGLDKTVSLIDTNTKLRYMES